VPESAAESAEGAPAAVLTGTVFIWIRPPYAPHRRNTTQEVFSMPPDTIQPIQDILNRWVLTGQALVASVGALAFVLAFLWKMTAVESRSVLQAKQWIQRIVVGTLGVELAGILVHVLTGSIPH
jgi:hypothetical protein